MILYWIFINADDLECFLERLQMWALVFVVCILHYAKMNIWESEGEYELWYVFAVCDMHSHFDFFLFFPECPLCLFFSFFFLGGWINSSKTGTKWKMQVNLKCRKCADILFCMFHLVVLSIFTFFGIAFELPRVQPCWFAFNHRKPQNVGWQRVWYIFHQYMPCLWCRWCRLLGTRGQHSWSCFGHFQMLIFNKRDDRSNKKTPACMCLLCSYW